jgi:hypothetical protein
MGGDPGRLAGPEPAQVEDGLRVLAIVLAPLVYAVATWRLGVRGALIALVGFVIVGGVPVLRPLAREFHERAA